jgi:outer membrane protein assembly factor BamB
LLSWAQTPPVSGDSELLVPTFLGNDQRRFYGRGVLGGSLKVLNKFNLGTGETNFKGETHTWSGAGWTGQPALVKDGGRLYLVQGSYDHHLRKIDLETYKECWRYTFDDVVKASPTVYIDPTATAENRIVVTQGSRIGKGIRVRGGQPAPSFRAVSFRTGKELWRMDVRETRCYSRDHDASALDLGNGVLFTSGENSIGIFLDSRTAKASKRNGLLQPAILGEVKLYNEEDAKIHGGDLLVEGSPARVGDKIYIASGTGRVYGIDIPTKQIVWEYYTGTDLNGTMAISKDNKLFLSIEKQYVKGMGGIMKLDPAKNPSQAVEWFLPTQNVAFHTWEGGVIGSIAINDEYRDLDTPPLWASHAIDGYLYLGSQLEMTNAKADGPRFEAKYPVPKLAAKVKVGASISTPIFADGNHLISAGYGGLHIFKIHFAQTEDHGDDIIWSSNGKRFRVRLEEKRNPLNGMGFEATPIVWDGRIHIASRDGFLYAIG